MVEPAWTWSLRRDMPSSKEVGHEIIEELLSALANAGWDGRDYFHVQMAASEAMVNAVTHGNQESPDKSVEVEFKISRSEAYLRFRDEGSGFCPDELPDPRDDDHLECTNGRGVMLIQELMSEVRYNASGNEVEMVKHRESAANAGTSE